MIKHVNGRNVSESINVQARSDPDATNEGLTDYVKSITRKIIKMIVMHTRKKIHITI